MTKTKQIIIGLLASLSCSLFALPSWAGSESHGGDGVVIGGKVYLLDLMEAGLEETAFINPDFPGDPKVIARLNEVFEDFGVPSQMLASKLAEIESLNGAFGRSLLLGIQQITWNLVKPELVQVADENSPVDLNKLTHIQLAIRSGRDVLVNRAGWEKMSDVHKVALILHETLFAMVELDKRKVGEEKVGSKVKEIFEYSQSSRKARAVNGYLFRKSFVKMGVKNLSKILAYGYGSYIGDLSGLYFSGINESFDKMIIEFIQDGEWAEDIQVRRDLTAEAQFHPIREKLCYPRDDKEGKKIFKIRIYGGGGFDVYLLGWETYTSGGSEANRLISKNLKDGMWYVDSEYKNYDDCFAATEGAIEFVLEKIRKWQMQDQ